MAPIVEEYDSKEAKLAASRWGLGASDSAAACGRSPWKTRLDLWFEKRGLADRAEATIPMRVGTALEGLLIELYMESMAGQGWAVRTWEQNRLMRSREYPWMTCTPDGLGTDGRLVELKTASDGRDWGEAGSDQIPLHYLLQVHHQMIVAEAAMCDVAVLIGGRDFRVYTIHADGYLQEAVISLERDFWGYVERGEAPPEESPTPLQLAKLNPECEGEIMLHGIIGDEVVRYQEIANGIRYLEKERDKAKSVILQAMGNHQIGRLGDGSYVKRFLERHEARVQTVREHTRHYFRVVGGRGEEE